MNHRGCTVVRKSAALVVNDRGYSSFGSHLRLDTGSDGTRIGVSAITDSAAAGRNCLYTMCPDRMSCPVPVKWHSSETAL